MKFLEGDFVQYVGLDPKFRFMQGNIRGYGPGPRSVYITPTSETLEILKTIPNSYHWDSNWSESSWALGEIEDFELEFSI